MNLNSFQIRTISTLYALTGVWIECININRPAWASADKLSTISQREDWSYRARSRREAPPGNELSACGQICFFPEVIFNARACPGAQQHCELVFNSSSSSRVSSGAPGPPWKESDRPPSYKSLRMLFWLWKQSRFHHPPMLFWGAIILWLAGYWAQFCLVTSETVILFSLARHGHWFF